MENPHADVESVSARFSTATTPGCHMRLHIVIKRKEDARDMCSSKYTTQTLLVVCVGVWIACAINPFDFEAWLLEQFATLCALAVLAWCAWRKVRFSTTDKISIAVLFVVHTVGSHFTYSLTPYDSFLQSSIGVSLHDLTGWQRNQYNRFVHLMYGVCLALPSAAVLTQHLRTSAFAARFQAFHLIISTSALYELVEWRAALLFGQGLGALYLGTQVDTWDAQADVALAGVGQLCVYALHTTFTTTRPGLHAS